MPTPAPAVRTPTLNASTHNARTLDSPARLHPELDCGTGEWDKLVYGNHRIVVEVPSGFPQPAPGRPRACTVTLPWRRQDPDPAAVQVIVVSEASGRRVSNVVAGACSRAAGTFTFEPGDGPGRYHFHYLPYAMVGPAHYPQAEYLPARPTADPAWVRDTADTVWAPAPGTGSSTGADGTAGTASARAPHPEAVAVRYESASDWDSFAPMNFTATDDELKVLDGFCGRAPFVLFAEDRRHPVSMRDRIPAHWALRGPDAVATSAVATPDGATPNGAGPGAAGDAGSDGGFGPGRTLRATAQPGEDYVLQLGLHARQELAGVSVTVDAEAAADPGLNAVAGMDAAANMDAVDADWQAVRGRCLNTEGTDRLGRPFSKTLEVPAGAVQALYVILPVPVQAAGGRLRAVVTVACPAGTASVELDLDVAAAAEPDITAGGCGDPRELRRLAWLDSTLAQDDELTAPFNAVRVDQTARTLTILGRTLQLAPNGLPAQLSSTFTSAVTAVDGPVRSLLLEPLALDPEPARGPAAWSFTPLEFTVHGPARIGWTCAWTSPDTPLHVRVQGQLEADGAASFAVRLAVPQGAGPVELRDVALRMVLDPVTVPYAMGLGVPGGTRPAAIDWHWDVPARNQDSLWLGDANIGVQLALRDDNYERPLNTNFYREKPLIAPESWANPGAEHAAAGVTLKEAGGGRQGDAVVLQANSGGRTMAPGDHLNYGFRLLLTPFKPIETARQLRHRYFHDQGGVADIAAAGASVVNIHHATALAPFINDPLLHTDALAEYTAQAHAAGLRVKVYDTVRELTAHSPDLLAMLSLGREIFSGGPGRGHIWLQEHVGGGYVSAWYAPNVDDVAVVSAGESRLQNWYIRGLDELVRRTGIDGIYLDDIAYDRQAMKRVRKVLAARCAEPEIDIHSANQFNEKDGFASSANMYMEQLPYTDRLWLGEYFDYEGTDPAYWLVEVSGIPFGLMGEMLEGGGNPWRGMVFGMTGRAPHVDNRPLWRFWAEHGLEAAPMVGWWSSQAPVRTNRPDVLATSWITSSGLVTALASWAPEPVDVTLEFSPEFAHLAGGAVAAPAIAGFQDAACFAAGDAIALAPGRGALLVITAP